MVISMYSVLYYCIVIVMLHVGLMVFPFGLGSVLVGIKLFQSIEFKLGFSIAFLGKMHKSLLCSSGS